MSELLPCPFCGGWAKIEVDDSYFKIYHVECQSCFAKSRMHNKDSVIEAWNTRYKPESKVDE